MAATKLTAPNGAAVSVDSKRVDSLIRSGFTKGEAKKPAKKASAKKSTSSKSSE